MIWNGGGGGGGVLEVLGQYVKGTVFCVVSVQNTLGPMALPAFGKALMLRSSADSV